MTEPQDKPPSSDLGDDWLEEISSNLDAGASGGQKSGSPSPPAPSLDPGKLEQDDLDSLLAGASPPLPEPPQAESQLELNQDAIDSLPGLDSAGPPNATPAISTELDQNDIDSLFAEGAPPEPAKAAPAPPTGDAPELDQNDIDSLFAESVAPEPAKAAPVAPTGDAPELDQNDIDSLFAESVAPEPAKAAPIAPTGDAPELDQNDIDSLFAESVAPEPAKAAPAAPTGDAPELDQNEIDRLFAEGGAPEPQQSEARQEFDQSAIDSLIGGEDLEVSKGAAASDNEFQDLEQSDIDQMLAEGLAKHHGEPESVVASSEGDFTLDQSDLDKLFAQSDSLGLEPETPRPASTDTDIAALDESDIERLLQESAGIDQDPSSDAHGVEISFDEILGKKAEGEAIPPVAKKEAVAPKPPKPRPTAAKAPPTTSLKAKVSLAAILMNIKSKIPPKIMASIAAGLVLCLGIGIFFLSFRGEKHLAEAPEATPETPTTAQVQPAPPPPPNQPPEVRDDQIRVEQASKEVALTLYAQDPDADPVEIEIVKAPSHGRIAGKYPALTYMPNQDFPGEDTLQYQATDGKATSRLATISVTGPDLTQTAVVEPPTAPPPQELTPRAGNVTLATKSTESLVIDWKAIWRRSNKEKMPDQITVEVLDTKLRGTLRPVDRLHFRYEPLRIFSGEEVVPYRFVVGKTASKKGRLTLRVTRNDFPPKIRLAPLPTGMYKVAEQVILDASRTEDERRNALTFKWGQVSGVPVVMTPVNGEGSAVSLIVPSSFHTMPYPDLVVQLTVVDSEGQEAKETIPIKVDAPTTGNRRAALWPSNPPRGR